MMDYSVDGDGIATITWNVANRPMNVMNEQSVPAFCGAVDKALGDDAVKGVIIASAKKEFLVGADLAAMEGKVDAEALVGFVAPILETFRRMEKSGKPFVAAINGHALGGGYETCLACHHRIVADDPRIKLGLPEAKVGLLPGAGGTQRLPRLIGLREALPLMLEGKEVNPQAALKLGMVDAVVPAGELLAAAKSWLLSAAGDKDKATQPWDRKGYRMPGGNVQSPSGQQTFVAGNAMLHAKTYGNYPGPQNIMSAVFEGCTVDIDTGLKIETRYFLNTAMRPESKNLIRFFFSMTEANKGGRRPANVPTGKLETIGVLGAGMMGAGIAHVTAAAGMNVVLIDASQEAADRGRQHTADMVAKQVARGRLSQDRADEVVGRVKATTDFADLKDCDFVIEAVFENRGIKAEVTQKTEAVCRDDIVFASNTSTLPITGLAEASQRPANFIGLHFFSPVERMPLIEIIRGEKTSDETLARAIDYVKAIRKTPIVVNDGRGFYTSRVFSTYVREGLAMLAEGVNPALIENAGRMAGMPVGPLALADEVSLDLMHKVGSQTKADLGDKYQGTPADDVVARMVEGLERIGRKASKGFYDYPEGGKKRLWPGLAGEFPAADVQPDVEEVKKRLTYIQSVEAARCMEDNIVTEPRDADVGSIMGWGFPASKGGVISQIDMIGAGNFVAECERMAQAYGPRFSPPKLLRDMAASGGAFYPAPKAA